MSKEIEEAKDEPSKFAAMVIYYSNNAAEYVKTEDFQKASEMMWGALSSVIKAVAAKNNKEIKSHKQLAEFARELAKNEKNKEIFDSFSKASTLHRNFYEANLDQKSIRILIDDIRKIIGKLMKNMGYRAP